MKHKDPLLGGMALIEGVMMKSPTKVGFAVRKPDGKIHTEVKPYIPWAQRYKILSLPLIRGAIGMIEMMALGTNILQKSANLALDEPETQEEQAKNKNSKKSKTKETLTTWSLIFSIIISLGFAILLFKFLPFSAAKFITEQVPYLLPVIEGIIKMIVFLGYLIVISFIPDIYRVFQYHGAEHKTITCNERKLPLTIANVKKMPRLHPRCGTSFMIFVILLSIVLYSGIPASIGFWQAFGLRILLLPILAGVSYEILRFSAAKPKSIIFKAISLPGMWTQLITTKEPDEKQIEVGIKSLELVLEKKSKA